MLVGADKERWIVDVEGLTEQTSPILDTDAFEDRRTVCREALASGALDYVGYHTVAGEYVHMDLFQRFAPDHVHDIECLREHVLALGRQLAFRGARLDRTLSAAASGALIRVVAQTDGGVVTHNSVIPGQDLIGLRFTRPGEVGLRAPLTSLPGVDEADQASSLAVARIRTQLGLGTRDPGGFEHPLQDLRAVEPHELQRVGHDGDLIEKLISFLELDGLHYAAFVDSGDVLCSADVMGAGLLSRFRTQASPEVRRVFLISLAQGLPVVLRDYGTAVRRVLGSPIRRLVLDVEQGAIYAVPIRTQTSALLGVTLFQSAVQNADARLAALALELEKQRPSAGRRLDGRESLSQ